MFCSKCGKEISDEARFCASCGSPVPRIRISSDMKRPVSGNDPIHSTDDKAVLANEAISNVNRKLVFTVAILSGCIIGMCVVSLAIHSKHSKKVIESEAVASPEDQIATDISDEADNSADQITNAYWESGTGEVENPSDEDNEGEEYLLKYREVLNKIIDGDTGCFSYKDAPNPGFALYDIDTYRDDIYELFVTDDTLNPDHQYTVFYLDENKNVVQGITINEYIPMTCVWVEKQANTKNFYVFENEFGFGKAYTIEETSAPEKYIRTDFVPDSDFKTYYQAWAEGKIREVSSEISGQGMMLDSRIEPIDIKWVNLTKETAESLKTGVDDVLALADKYMEEYLPDQVSGLRDYKDLLERIISGEEPMYGDFEMYSYSEALNPGYALYDIDGDGTKELFVTENKDSEVHTYTVYYYSSFSVGGLEYKVLDGYYPDKGLWVRGTDYYVDAYKFNNIDGFWQQWEIHYPEDDDEAPVTISYRNDTVTAISESELEALYSGRVTEPSDLQWIALTEDIVK